MGLGYAQQGIEEVLREALAVAEDRILDGRTQMLAEKGQRFMVGTAGPTIAA